MQIFVGSSSESEAVLDQVMSLLKGPGRRPVSWKSAFPPSGTTIGSLLENSKESDFAILIMTGDDRVVSRKVEYASVRDNVLFELGLFMGSLGSERVFLLEEREAKVKIASDLHGITRVLFDAGNTDSLTWACLQIIKRMQHLGPFTLASSNFFKAPGRSWFSDYKFDREGGKLHNWGERRRSLSLYRGISLYWLGHDLLWTVCALLTRQGARQVKRGLIQVAWQLEQCGLFDDHFYGWVRDTAKGINHQLHSSQKRKEVAETLLVRAHSIGDLINNAYKRDPARNAPDEYLPLPPRPNLPENVLENRPYKFPSPS